MFSFVERLSQIKKTMRQNKKTQVEVAENLGSTQSWVSRILSGHEPVQMAFLLRIIQEVDHPIEELFPDLKGQLMEIIRLLEAGAERKATVNLINLIELSNEYDQPNQDTETTV